MKLSKCRIIVANLLLVLSLSINANSTEKLIISFSENPAISPDQCNPLVTYEYISSIDNPGISITFNIDSQGVTTQPILKKSKDSYKSKSKALSVTTIDNTCSDLSLTIESIKCSDPATFMLIECSVRVEVKGTDMFANFINNET